MSKASASDDGPMLTAEELAERWNSNIKTIYEAIRIGQLPAFKLGKRRLLIPRAVIEAIEQGRGMPEGKG